MTEESHHIQVALTQMLETFQRCGVSRFGCLPASQLPVQWLDCLAKLKSQPLPVEEKAQDAAAYQNGGRSPESASKTAGPSTVSEAALLGGRLSPSSSSMIEMPKAGLLKPGVSDAVSGKGRSAEPWSLPVLDNVQLQKRFDVLAGQIRDCRKCTAIVDHRQQTVFGDGPFGPTVCFMGEAPGADEDRTGKPFVGKAGQLLTKIISAMKLRREEVYILNALKCRPPQNRTPVNEEIDNCRHFVEEQLDALQPKFIVCLGAVAVRSILQSDLSIGQLRGKFYQYRGARVVVTYHPSYLLRNESAKKLVWDDMKMLMAAMLPA